MRAAMVACNVAGTLTSATSATATDTHRGSPCKHATFGEFADDLLGEERVAGCPFGDASGLARRVTGPDPISSVISAADLRIIERCKRNRLCAGYRAQRTLVLRPVGDQHQ